MNAFSTPRLRGRWQVVTALSVPYSPPHLGRVYESPCTQDGQIYEEKGLCARKRRDHNKEYVRRCYKCKSPDHVVADCPYNSDNNEDEKKKHKKEKEKK